MNIALAGDKALGFGKILLVGVGAIAVYKLLQMIGIIESKEDKQARLAAAAFNKYLRALTDTDNFKTISLEAQKQYLKSNKKPSSWKYSDIGSNIDLKKIGNKIYDSKGTFGDDENSLYDSFQNVLYSLDFWVINDYFRKAYNVNVIDFIDSFTNDKEKARIYNIFSKRQVAKGLPSLQTYKSKIK